MDTIIIEDENIPENIEGITIAIENLGNPCKQLLELFYYKNESWDDIAERECKKSEIQMPGKT